MGVCGRGLKGHPSTRTCLADPVQNIKLGECLRQGLSVVSENALSVAFVGLQGGDTKGSRA